jgi:hypothetical protein
VSRELIECKVRVGNEVIVTDQSFHQSHPVVPLLLVTSGAQSMAGMFNNCTNFNQRLAFNTQLVIDMSAMFSGCTAFNQTLDFDTGAVENMSAMFLNCRQFDLFRCGCDVLEPQRVESSQRRLRQLLIK